MRPEIPGCGGNVAVSGNPDLTIGPGEFKALVKKDAWITSRSAFDELDPKFAEGLAGVRRMIADGRPHSELMKDHFVRIDSSTQQPIEALNSMHDVPAYGAAAPPAIKSRSLHVPEW